MVSEAGLDHVFPNASSSQLLIARAGQGVKAKAKTKLSWGIGAEQNISNPHAAG